MALQAAALAVLLVPLAGAFALGVTALRIPRWSVWAIGPGVVWAAFIGALILLADSLQYGKAHDFTYWTWIQSGAFNVPANLLVDRLSIFMCLVVTGVGGLIITYAVGYMEHETDPSYARFFCYMDLFVFSMLLLVLAGNFVFLIMGWALVGLSSYLLIGFNYWRYSAVVAARKAFVMNVIGDVGMILAAFAIFVNYRSITFAGVFGALPNADNGWVEVIAFLLLVGGIAKSAQLPLHTWLPDAMEGPTPVSALIHAATMVTAGVYMVARSHVLFERSGTALEVVAWVGVATALFGATVGLIQTDIKRVLAYSTISQLGYMFAAVGLGAYAAGIFHLVTHAFFKALLFLGAGSVIHALGGEQDLRKMGGLSSRMVGTTITTTIGALGLAGLPGLSGFFSKDEILAAAFTSGQRWMWAFLLLGAFLTAFYTARMLFLAFYSGPRMTREAAHHVHESPGGMTLPLVVLAILTVVTGVAIGIPSEHGTRFERFLAPVFPLHEGAHGGFAALLILVLAVLVFAGGVALAWFMYMANPVRPAEIGQPKTGVHALLLNAYYVDTL